MPEFKDIGKASKDLFKKVKYKSTLASESCSDSKIIYGSYQITLAIQLWKIGH